jgi:hypothetical protein
MSDSLQNLYRCADDVQDYFRSMGGANQYSGFMNWHIPAFVLLINKDENESELLPYGIWRDTKALQESIKSRLLSNPPSTDAISDFINRTTQATIKFKNPMEGIEWLEFCKSIQPEGVTMDGKFFTEEQIRVGYAENCRVLEKHGLPTMTLEQFKDSLNYPPTEDNYPPLYRK